MLEVLQRRVNGESIADVPRSFKGDVVSWWLVFKSVGKPDRESSTNPFDLLSDAILELTKLQHLVLKVMYGSRCCNEVSTSTEGVGFVRASSSLSRCCNEVFKYDAKSRAVDWNSSHVLQNEIPTSIFVA